MISFENSTKAREVLSAATKAIEDYGMAEKLLRGVLVGLSGGADSVMLLLTLCELRKTLGDFVIKAVHVNHMIRDGEAIRDEEFSRELCLKLDIPFSCERVDVPQLAKELSCGTEEAARRARYSIFDKIINVSEDLACVAVAHNSTDNLETIIFNIMRGAGIAGASGIPPVRDNVIRPLIYSSKQDITAALDSIGVSYVTDSTNLDTDYSRNHIRANIIPELYRLTPSPEKMATRFSSNLREDNEFINTFVDKFLKEHFVNGKISKNALISVPKSIFHRIIAEIAGQKTDFLLERVHSNAIYSKLSDDNFSISIPGGMKFVCEYGICSIENDCKENCKQYDIALDYGVNVIDGYDSVVLISDDSGFESFRNIYKIEIASPIPSDIIGRSFRVRSKQDGDAYSYGGMTHKLKKLFQDRSIPKSRRADVPVFVDNEGIIWVPGFGKRSFDSERGVSYVAIAVPMNESSQGKRLYFCSGKK